MKWGIKVSILFIPWLVSLPAQSQYLHFNKLNHRVYANYRVGDDISFQVKETGERFDGMILGITDSTLVFEYYEFNPDEIAAIFIDGKIMSHYMLKFKWYRVLIFTGIGYPLLETVNNRKTEPESVRQGLLLMGTGLFLRLIMRDKLPIDERHTLTIINNEDLPDPLLDPADQ